jgi:hypothetical protein
MKWRGRRQSTNVIDRRGAGGGGGGLRSSGLGGMLGGGSGGGPLGGGRLGGGLGGGVGLVVVLVILGIWSRIPQITRRFAAPLARFS